MADSRHGLSGRRGPTQTGRQDCRRERKYLDGFGSPVQHAEIDVLEHDQESEPGFSALRFDRHSAERVTYDVAGGALRGWPDDVSPSGTVPYAQLASKVQLLTTESAMVLGSVGPQGQLCRDCRSGRGDRQV